MAAHMSVQVGDDARVKATHQFGTVTATNGHAHKLCGKWFYKDELEIVSQETGTIPINGEERNYTLFRPTDLSHPINVTPRPALLFVHGLLGDRSKHQGLARRLCQALGAIVMVPDVVPLMSPLGLDEEVCIREVTAHAAWLARQHDCDANRLVLGGFSAGGAAALEAVADLQQSGLKPAALALLDPVPWTRTAKAAKRLEPLRGGILLLLSEPSMTTNYGAFHKNIMPLLATKHAPCQDLSHFRVGDLMMLTVNDAQHVDAESASTPRARSSEASASSVLRELFNMVSAPMSKERAHTFYLFVQAFLADVFGVDCPSSSDIQGAGSWLSSLQDKLETEVRFGAEPIGVDPTLVSIAQTFSNIFAEPPSEKSANNAGCPTQ